MKSKIKPQEEEKLSNPSLGMIDLRFHQWQLPPALAL